MNLWLFAVLALCAAHKPKELPQAIVSYFPILRTGYIPYELTNSIKAIGKIPDKHLKSEVFCDTCILVFTEVLEYRQTGASKESMTYFFQQLCKAFTDWGTVACRGYIENELDTALYIMDHKEGLTSNRICATYFQEHACKDPNANEWTVLMPSAQSPKNATHIHICESHVVPLKILHLTDFHYDPEYSPGSNAECDSPLCCQKSNGPAPKPSKAAGFWGDYRACDIPWHTITNFTHHLSIINETYDFVYYTGDVISHKFWETNEEININTTRKLLQHLNRTFTNVSILPVIGNNEPHPLDFWLFQHGTSNSYWDFDLLASEWSSWIPKEADATIINGGFYTVKTSKSKLRIVGLNTNLCYIGNLWLIYEDEDPYGQLDWLVKVLTEAEREGEIVHILSHMQPGDLKCHQRWSNQYRKIIERFAPIIVGQFHGHTHTDELRLFPAVNDTENIINAAFVAGSFATSGGFNPNYRIYDVDPNNFRVLNYRHYTFNLSEANLDANEPPKWYQLYSFKDAYGLEDTTYTDYADLLLRMLKDNTFLDKYRRLQGRESEPWLSKKCDNLCFSKILCGITAVETQDAMRCQ